MGETSMPEAQSAAVGLQAGSDVFFLLAGAVLVLAVHAGLAFLEAGTVRQKNRADALRRILVLLAVSTVSYSFVGYAAAHGARLFSNVRDLAGAAGGFEPQGVTLARFAFLCAVAALVPAIVSGGIAERARLLPQCVAAAVIAGVVYPFLEGLVWNGGLRAQDGFQSRFGEEFHDYAGAIVVHAMGGWLAFAAIRRVGPRLGRYTEVGTLGPPPSSVPLLALGAWLACIGLLGLNVTSAGSVRAATGLVAANALLAMCGGILAAAVAGDGEPGFVHNGALAGLIAVSAGADVMHPVGALLVGGVAGIIYVVALQVAADPNYRLDDARGAWALHGLCGLWGGIACGVFGLAAFGGMGGVSLRAQVVGSLLAAAYALVAGAVVYALVDVFLGLRLSAEDERRGADPMVRKAADAA
jgi:Amt family ammonium transporter